jgi:hypothetical protein
MKVGILVLSCVAFASAAPQSLPGVDIPGALLGSFNEVTRQINSLQSILSELNGQVSRLIQSGTRLVSGLDADSNTPTTPQIPNFGNTGGLVGAVIGSVQQVTGQLTNIQRTIHEMTTQLQRMVETGSRIVTGPLHYDDNSLPQLPNPNIAEAALKTFGEWAQQLQSINSVLREMNQQWSRVIDTGSKMITGKLLAEDQSSSNPIGIPGLGAVPGAEAIQSALNLLSNQFTSIQRALTDFSSQLTRMVESGVRAVGGLDGETASPPSVNPGDAVLNVVNTLTQQFTQVQRVLQELNGQLNRMVETGSRVLG